MLPDPQSPIQTPTMWLWWGQVVAVTDGDTIVVRLDRGFRDTSVRELRLKDAWAPEIHGLYAAEGAAAKAWVVEWLLGCDQPRGLAVRTYKETPETFTRFVAVVWRVSDGACLNEDIVRAGLAYSTKAGLKEAGLA